ncbi:hypothetical protein JCM15457_2247 [Liquorilactobacillus sucicola DSM 21376 = JCM 15457]|uniref:Uncharacterized protein n=1 Tax=Liquorilactobacillus sucicola DSM 21376 = JCM 15457 TaxID=1423806 RepID=A0A023CZQ4_9LACO|nr:hypothetical protein FD15_GL001606 [Liquorilactobacillus sucicola DSM 21376 = JCM 15457]GAJ27274.1 hypothetical protein JCM15457_2247 [Liquorilactobacillus sucicola DSM 21376 = JCM 15457]
MLDGDEPFGDFESSNTDSYLSVSNFKIAMARLSGPDICDVAKRLGATLWTKP